jgi:hypothetical protein
MKELDPQHLFYDSPYPVKLDDGEYIFRTDHDIVYAVSFKPEPFFDPIPAYWFDLMNRSDMASPSDPKVRETVIRIIVEFFRANPDIMLYMCDSANKPQ